MNTIDLSTGFPSLGELLELASNQNIILRTPDGRDFVLAEVDDFDRELELVRQNRELLRFLEDRSQTGRAYTLDEIRQQLKISEREQIYPIFWDELLKKASLRTALHDGISPGIRHFIQTCRKGFCFRYTIRYLEPDAQVTLSIQRPDPEENRRIYHTLHDKKETIEQTFGAPLTWRPTPEYKSSIITYTIPGAGLQKLKREQWPAIQDKMIDAMVRLETTMLPELRDL